MALSLGINPSNFNITQAMPYIESIYSSYLHGSHQSSTFDSALINEIMSMRHAYLN